MKAYTKRKNNKYWQGAAKKGLEKNMVTLLFNKKRLLLKKETEMH